MNEGQDFEILVDKYNDLKTVPILIKRDYDVILTIDRVRITEEFGLDFHYTVLENPKDIDCENNKEFLDMLAGTVLTMLVKYGPAQNAFRKSDIKKPDSK